MLTRAWQQQPLCAQQAQGKGLRQNFHAPAHTDAACALQRITHTSCSAGAPNVWLALPRLLLLLLWLFVPPYPLTPLTPSCRVLPPTSAAMILSVVCGWGGWMSSRPPWPSRSAGMAHCWWWQQRWVLSLLRLSFL